MLGATLDRLTGDIVIGELRLGQDLKEGELVNSRSAHTVRQIRCSGSRNYYEAWQQVNPELEIGVTLGFTPGGTLQRIRAKFLKTGLRSLEWSKALEDDIKLLHDKWLEEQLGDPPYRYRWGKVVSLIDQHGYSAIILIDYTKTSAGIKAFCGRARRRGWIGSP